MGVKARAVYPIQSNVYQIQTGGIDTINFMPNNEIIMTMLVF
jgi:hypothetical protein